jgi:hypothetical protein
MDMCAIKSVLNKKIKINDDNIAEVTATAEDNDDDDDDDAPPKPLLSSLITLYLLLP